MKQLVALQHLLTDQYIPAGPEDFVGPTRAVAQQLRNFVDLSNASGRNPLRIVLNGPPGIAKSALARYFQRLLDVNPKWSTFKFSGVDVSVDKLRDLAEKFQLRDLFSPWRLIWIEEADTIPKAAQVRFLMLLDEMVPGTAVIATSNCKIEDFESRFQTRFTFPEPYIKPPTAEEIYQFLLAKAGPHPGLRQVAEFSCGNVRGAINDTVDLFLRHPIRKAA